jgi:hypothetical protein
LLVNIFTGTTNQAAIQAFTNMDCEIPASKDCIANATSLATGYVSNINLVAILFAIPAAIISSKLAQTKFINKIFVAL